MKYTIGALIFLVVSTSDTVPLAADVDQIISNPELYDDRDLSVLGYLVGADPLLGVDEEGNVTLEQFRAAWIYTDENSFLNGLYTRAISVELTPEQGASILACDQAYVTVIGSFEASPRHRAHLDHFRSRIRNVREVRRLPSQTNGYDASAC